MLRRIYRVMIKAYDEADADRAIAQDWLNDTKGAETLNRKRFCDAFFELADTCERLPCSRLCFRWPRRFRTLQDSDQDSSVLAPPPLSPSLSAMAPR